MVGSYPVAQRSVANIQQDTLYPIVLFAFDVAGHVDTGLVVPHPTAVAVDGVTHTEIVNANMTVNISTTITHVVRVYANIAGKSINLFWQKAKKNISTLWKKTPKPPLNS